jgi:hypothetical protein
MDPPQQMAGLTGPSRSLLPETPGLCPGLRVPMGAMGMPPPAMPLHGEDIEPPCIILYRKGVVYLIWSILHDLAPRSLSCDAVCPVMETNDRSPG